MASWVITDADRGPDGKIIVGAPFQPAPDESPLVPVTEPQSAPPQQRSHPSTEQAVAAFLPPPPVVPGVPTAPTPSWRVQLASGVLLVLLLLGWFAWQRNNALLPTSVPRLPMTTAPTTTATLPSADGRAAPGCTITHAAVTFYAPAGDATGDALDVGTACTLVGWHSGFPEWRQIVVAGNTPIWVRAAALNHANDTTGLLDLAPLPTTTPAPVQPTPLVIIEQAPAPLPEPTQCATVRGGGVVIQRCGAASIEQLQADAAAAWRVQMNGGTQ